MLILVARIVQFATIFVIYDLRFSLLQRVALLDLNELDPLILVNLHRATVKCLVVSLVHLHV